MAMHAAITALLPQGGAIYEGMLVGVSPEMRAYVAPRFEPIPTAARWLVPIGAMVLVAGIGLVGFVPRRSKAAAVPPVATQASAPLASTTGPTWYPTKSQSGYPEGAKEASVLAEPTVISDDEVRIARRDGNPLSGKAVGA